MTREEIDIMWQQALRDSVRDGEMFTRYHFAKMVADKEREACAKICDNRAEQMEALYEERKLGMSGYAIAFNGGVSSSSRRNATAIRARGEA